ncbi:eukaryotic translation initiation factor 5B-like [Gigantopelta aegis]|uniref:eukaryotic translation initiation factor 5B-like n=1 Tax=Gigantopelta aegis TaxID=1735272 RepID=UPI001B88C4D9|nr:eukaryotic translation initiation factor 5B-like [Gigantopelta aegis]
MGKPKKGQKGDSNDISDEEVSVDQPSKMADDNTSSAPNKSKAAKKEKKKNRGKNDDWEDDVAAEIAALALDGKSDLTNENEDDIEESKPAKKKEKKKKKKIESDEEEDEADGEVIVPEKGKKSKKPVASFQMLMMDDDEDEEHVSSGNEDVTDAVTEPVPAPVMPKSQKEKKKSKEKEKKKTTEEEDIDAILASLEKPTEKSDKKKKKKGKKTEEDVDSVAIETEIPEPAEEKVVTVEDLDEDDDKKKKKKSSKKVDDAEKDDEGEEGEENDEGGGTVKTQAQKRKEKREREKLKKLQEKQKKKKKEGDVEKEDTPENEGEAKGETKEGEDEGEEEGKMKKKKKKGEKEEKAKPKKHLAAIKAHLQMVKEEEERQQKEEEEKARLQEELQRQIEEQRRLEQEKREKRKEKEKARKERLKAEGKLLTDKQRKDQQRLNQMLQAMKEQGVEIPSRDDIPKKKPVYFDKKKRKQQTAKIQEPDKNPSPTEEQTPVLTPDTPTEKPEVARTVNVEVKDSWDLEEDIADAWDAEEEEEKKPKPKSVEVTVKVDEEVEEDEESKEEESEESDESDEETDSSEEESDDDRSPIERGRERIAKRHAECEKRRTTDKLRAPVVCVLGHVDTGKTKILDKLRRSHVQDGEAGGITQQIGATNVPRDAILEQTKMCKEFQKNELKVPGLLIIDTPGHESFSNLRSRGSSLCDIAILVVDLMHGLEPQTLESIKLLEDRHTPFVVALNKVDRLYQWKPMPNVDIASTLKKQSGPTKLQFDEMMNQVILQMAEQGLNVCLAWDNKDPDEYISMIPTSAHSGDGMGSLIAQICDVSQTRIAKQLAYSEELHATTMEVKAIPGLGTTVDVILVNGKLCEGETIVIAGTEGPITTQIRGLLMPQPMKELRVKNQYEHHKEILAAQGVKIIAKDLEKALAGLPLYVATHSDEIDYYKSELQQALSDVLDSINVTERGVFVQASTLGSLEALLEFLRTSKIPYAGISIGPVHKKDIMKASVMLEHDGQYAVILAFDVKVERDAQDLADSLGVKIFTADIIYHLFDHFMAYRDEQKKKKQEEFKHIAVFPCKLRVLPQFIFNSRDPIVIGVSVESGFLKEGTPICVPSREFVDLGRVTSIEYNHKGVDIARQGQEVCIKIESIPGEAPKLYGRHFDHSDTLVSKITRDSIDAVKNYFRDNMQKQDWMLIVELKKLFEIL